MNHRTYQNLEAGKTTRLPLEALGPLVELGFDLSEIVGRDTAEKLPGPLRPSDLPPEAVGEYVRVPRYDVRASAGAGALVWDENIIDWLVFKRSWVVGEMGLDPDKLALIAVDGDSMEPTLRSGDLVLVDTTAREVRGGGLYVIRLDTDLMVKRLQKIGPGKVLVRSDNEAAYNSFEAKLDGDLAVVGRVVWFCRALERGGAATGT